MRRVLTVLLVLTGVILLADLAGAPMGPVRALGAAILGPVERVIAPDPDEVDALQARNLELREQVRRLERRSAESAQADDLATADLTTTPARVVALERSGAIGPERLTIDVGRRDGIAVDSAVIAPGGLVGRVISVGEWTSDVEVIGSPDAAVAIRTGAKGVIGTLTRSDPTTAHDTDELVVTHLGRDRVVAGDEVVTLGSPDSIPYPAGIDVGTVTEVSRNPGELTDTALVTPGVDLATLDVVAVVTAVGAADGPGVSSP